MVNKNLYVPNNDMLKEDSTCKMLTNDYYCTLLHKL